MNYSEMDAIDLANVICGWDLLDEGYNIIDVVAKDDPLVLTDDDNFASLCYFQIDDYDLEDEDDRLANARMAWDNDQKRAAAIEIVRNRCLDATIERLAGKLSDGSEVAKAINDRKCYGDILNIINQVDDYCTIKTIETILLHQKARG